MVFDPEAYYLRICVLNYQTYFFSTFTFEYNLQIILQYTLVRLTLTIDVDLILYVRKIFQRLTVKNIHRRFYRSRIVKYKTAAKRSKQRFIRALFITR